MSFLLNIDHNSYGLRHNENNSNLMIGETPVTIRKNILDIKEAKFNITEGLAELLTKREPKNFDDDDILSYKQILTLTNAHKRKYGSVFRLKPSKSWKYENIISKLFPPKQKSSTGKRGATVKRLTNELMYNNEEQEEVGSKKIGQVGSGTILKRNEDMDPNYWKYENISKLFPPKEKRSTGKGVAVKRLTNELMYSKDNEDMDPSEVVDMIRKAISRGEDYQIYVNILRYMNIIE